LKLKTLAEIAAVGALILAVLQYMKIEPNAIDELPSALQDVANSDVKKIELTLDENEYASNSSIAYALYKAAQGITYTAERNDALEKAVAAALEENDYKLSIQAAREISYSLDMNRVLSMIASKALRERDSVGYAIVAAEFISYSTDKTKTLQKIIAVYEYLAEGGSIDDMPIENNDSLDIYKEIFVFADSDAYLGMNSSEAKDFVDDWLKNRNYQDFLLFKEVFIFSDSSAYLGKNTKSAMEFALSWLEHYTESDFEIFKEAFIFADSSAYLGMNAENATEFAISKVREHKAANKPIQSTPKSGATDR